MVTCSEKTKALLAKAQKTWEEFIAVRLSTHASSSAFFFFTSLIPIVIVTACIASHSGITEQDLVLFIGYIVPDALNGFVENVVREAFGNANLALTGSLIALLWTASKGIQALIDGLNAAYGVQDHRNFLQRAAISLVSVIAIILLLAAAMFLIFSDEIIRALSTTLPGIGQPDTLSTLMRAIVLLVVGLVIFALCYTFLPAGQRKLRHQLPGAVTTAVAWFTLSFGFRIYVDHSSSYNLFYGSLATVALFLFWLYCIFLILLVGGFINRYLDDRRNQKSSLQ